MDSALGWIGQIVEWLARFIPRWILLDTTEEAYKFTAKWRKVGQWKWEKYYTTSVLSFGGHWYWPWVSKVTSIKTARDTTDLEGQIVKLKDGKTVLVSAMVRTVIVDTLRAVGDTSDIGNCIRDEAMCAVHDVLEMYNYNELDEKGKEIREEMKRLAQRELTRYGVKVLRIGIKDLAPAKVLKLVQEQS